MRITLRREEEMRKHWQTINLRATLPWHSRASSNLVLRLLPALDVARLGIAGATKSARLAKGCLGRCAGKLQRIGEEEKLTGACEQVSQEIQRGKWGKLQHAT
jgi:hypothetical protein